MSQTTSASAGRIIGREAELAAVDAFVRATGWPRAFVLAGEPGVGKTTLWEAGVDLARQLGFRVLLARGSAAETQLSSTALIDLLDGVDGEELASLPAPQLQALEVALLRAEPTAAPPEPTAIALGLLNALRSLAAREPVLVAIDDVQWLDGASAEALAYAARRLDDEAIAFLLTQRPDSATALDRAFDGETAERLDIGDLSLGATRRMLSERLGLSLPRSVLRRVFEATLGNPLFTLELGRVLAASGPLELGQDIPLPETVEELLGARVAGLPTPVHRLLLTVALSGELRRAQATEIESDDALEDAIDAGVLVIDGDRVRPVHPLYAAAVRQRASRAELRAQHLALAELAGDEEIRAGHLALAADAPDERLAAPVAAAAESASARGARADAVVLAEHAVRLTPPDADARIERVLALGHYLAGAGSPHRLTELLTPELDVLPPGPARARALHLLTFGVVSDNDEIRGYLDEALEASGDDETLRATMLLEIAENEVVIRVQRIPTAEAWGLDALPAAEAAGGDLERHALYTLAWVRALRGVSIDDLCARYHDVSETASLLGESPERVAAQRLVWRGDLGPGRELLDRLRALADERGESYSYILMRLHLCQLELRAGSWDAAARLLDEWAASSERVMWPMYERCRGLLAAGRGFPDEAEDWAAQTLEKAARTGTNWDRLEALRARGLAALLVQEPGRAAESLAAVWEHTRREGVDEPGVFPVAPELVEALVELERLEDAAAVADRLRALSAEQEHPWGLASVRRSDALIRLASGGYDEGATAELAAAADAYKTLGLPFDRARTLLGLGQVHRRAKKWGTARESLERATAAFDELGSPGWAERARAELARVGGRRRQATGELTETERRVAELAAEGLANKEIASSLFVTERTVQVHLKRVYAKLGIRSRNQIARRLAELD